MPTQKFASVLLPPRFRFASVLRVKLLGRSAHFPKTLENSYGKPCLVTFCLVVRILSAICVCFRFASVLLPFCFRHAGKVTCF